MSDPMEVILEVNLIKLFTDAIFQIPSKFPSGTDGYKIIFIFFLVKDLRIVVSMGIGTGRQSGLNS